MTELISPLDGMDAYSGIAAIFLANGKQEVCMNSNFVPIEVTQKDRIDVFKVICQIKQVATSPLVQVLFQGTPNQHEAHWKRHDRLRVVSFLLAHKQPADVICTWCLVTGLLQTTDQTQTRRRWKHINWLLSQADTLVITTQMNVALAMFLSDTKTRHHYKPVNTFLSTPGPKNSMLQVVNDGRCKTTLFQLQGQGVNRKDRWVAYQALQDSLDMSKSKIAHLLLYGSTHQQEPHLKRGDRFKVTLFLFANGVSPHVARQWFWATGLLQTSDFFKTTKRWRQVEGLYCDLESGTGMAKYTTWDMNACCGSTHKYCYCKTAGRLVSGQTGMLLGEKKAYK